MGLGAHFFPLLFSLCLGVEIFWCLGFSGLGFSGGVWVDGSLGFGLGVVVEPWVCRGSWVCRGFRFAVSLGRAQEEENRNEEREKRNEEREKNKNIILIKIKIK